MAQTKVNGTVANFQALTANLVYITIDEVDGTDDISDLTTVNGNAETVLKAVATVANPVIVESSNARVMYAAVEIGGANVAGIEAAVQAVTNANATVTAGSFAVV